MRWKFSWLLPSVWLVSFLMSFLFPLQVWQTWSEALEVYGETLGSLVIMLWYFFVVFLTPIIGIPHAVYATLGFPGYPLSYPILTTVALGTYFVIGYVIDKIRQKRQKLLHI